MASSSYPPISDEDIEALLAEMDDEEDDLPEPEDIRIDKYFDAINNDFGPSSSQEAEELRKEERALSIQEKIRQEREAEKTSVFPESSYKREEDPKRIQYQAPGIKLFTKRFLNGFVAEDLNLEKEFGYEKRQKLKEIGILDEQLDEIFGDPYVFIMYLCPEASSALIGNELDFIKVCDYVFFFCASCVDELVFELYKKALFDLFKNYAYKWKLRLQHIYTALCNLGIKIEALGDEEHILGLMKTRLEVAEKLSKRKGKSRIFSLPKGHDFYVNRVSAKENISNDETSSEINDKKRWSCIKNFIRLVSELVVSFLDHTEFRPITDDWCNQLYLLYLFNLVGTDYHLIHDSLVCRDIMVLNHFQFDSFSSYQWSGKTSEQSRSREESLNNEMTNACCDISEILAQVGGNSSLKTWERNEVPAHQYFENLDHHHNMVRRLEFFPFSLRGNQVKKNVAYLNLQLIIDTDEYDLLARADINDVCEMFEKPDNKRKLKVLFKEYYAMISVIKLLDLMVGNEPSDNSKIAYIKEILFDYAKRLKDDARNTDPARVKEVISQVTSKWKVIADRFESYQTTGTTYKKSMRRRHDSSGSEDAV